MKNQRRIRNAIVDSKAQLRMLAPYIIFLVFTIFAILILNYLLLRLVGTSIAVEDQRAMSVFNQVAIRVQLWSGFVMLLSGLLAFALWIIYSHRVQGASYAINQQLKKMLNQNFDSKIQLRSRDELADIAESVNKLTDQLREKIGGSTPG